MIDKKVNEYRYKLLKKSKYETSKPAISRQSTFLSKLQKTFWVVQPNVEKRLKDMHSAGKLQNKDDSRDLENYLYLEGVRGVKHTATFGSRDIRLAKRKLCSASVSKALASKQAKSSTATIVEFTSDSDSADDCFADNEEKEPNCSSAVLTEQTGPHIIPHVGSGIFPVDGVGRILYRHCLYHSSPFRSITCILFPQSIFLHLILYLLFPRLFRSSSSSTTTHFKFQSLHYHIFIFFPQNMTVPPYTACFSHSI